ncbi:LysR family transcriptional regulator [Dyella sp. BiH032]|uniref:LysR family transcriptional regulator n=1 Tax=Dyella sp. BiH032 TaxID=3075430 RepID=UPI0028931406|nr:LysR family transcriptional regulator [Dyella sp. BiH032]WNL46026.1 LysR family transcriptional regulator [Dyella sp. BiH032]
MVDLRGIDLNLLVTLDMLLAERNVTRAATRLHLTQPAVSTQLARLRRVFGDPLLIPAESGRGMVPSAYALAMAEPLRAALKDLESVLRYRAGFDPREAKRRFVIAASDNATSVLGIRLMEALSREAGPGVAVAFVVPELQRIAAQLESGEVDLLLGSERMVPSAMKARKLYDERFVLAQRKGHPRGARPPTLPGYCALRHVLVSTSGGSFHGFMDEHLEALGRKRDVVASVQSFAMAVELLCATDCVATLPARLAMRHADRLDSFRLPFKAHGFTLSAAWHPRNHADPGLRWLLERVSGAVA